MKVINKRFYNEPTKVVDLQIKDIHNFAIGKEGIIVHNSYLRPRGSFIYGIGVESPGAVKYMELFDKSSDIITSGSGKDSTHLSAKKKIRKGAMMGVMDINHPDIVEFITAKQSSNRLSKFNMSVNCTDDFMNKVIKIKQMKENKSPKTEIDKIDTWDLVFPDTTYKSYKKEWTGNFKEWKNKGYPILVHDTVKVSWLWNLIMESTYQRAEPGVLFLDRANDNNPGYYFENIIMTNPCITGDTVIKTDKGDIRIDELTNQYKSNENFKVMTYNIDTQLVEYEDIIFADKTRQDADIIELELDDGTILKLTPDHKVYTKNRGYIEASLLDDNDILLFIE